MPKSEYHEPWWVQLIIIVLNVVLWVGGCTLWRADAMREKSHPVRLMAPISVTNESGIDSSVSEDGERGTNGIGGCK